MREEELRAYRNKAIEKDRQAIENRLNHAFNRGYEMGLKMAKPSWIPCSERLLEEHKEVIVTDIETSDTYQSQYVGNGYWECDNGLFNNRIIAWQPKPKPYKAESEGV